MLWDKFPFIRALQHCCFLRKWDDASRKQRARTIRSLSMSTWCMYWVDFYGLARDNTAGHGSYKKVGGEKLTVYLWQSEHCWRLFCMSSTFWLWHVVAVSTKIEKIFLPPNSFHFSFVTANVRDDVEYHQSRELVESFNLVLSLPFLKWISALYSLIFMNFLSKDFTTSVFDLKLNSKSVAAAGRLKVNSYKLSRLTTQSQR